MICLQRLSKPLEKLNSRPTCWVTDNLKLSVGYQCQLKERDYE